MTRAQEVSRSVKIEFDELVLARIVRKRRARKGIARNFLRYERRLRRPKQCRNVWRAKLSEIYAQCAGHKKMKRE